MRSGISARHGAHQVAQKLTMTTLPCKEADDTSRPSRSLAANRGAAAGLRKNRSVTGPPPIDGAPASASTPAFCEEPSTRREYLEAAHVTRRAPTTTTATSAKRANAE